MTFVIFLSWLALSAAVGVFASQRRNRSGFGWFVLALLISPFIAFCFAAAMKEKEPRAPSVIVTPNGEVPQVVSGVAVAFLAGAALFAVLLVAVFAIGFPV
jgi:hypothetical protein